MKNFFRDEIEPHIVRNLNRSRRGKRKIVVNKGFFKSSSGVNTVKLFYELKKKGPFKI